MIFRFGWDMLVPVPEGNIWQMILTAFHPGTSGYGCPLPALTTTEPKPSCEGNVDFWSKRKMVPWWNTFKGSLLVGTQIGLDGWWKIVRILSSKLRWQWTKNITIFNRRYIFFFIVMLVFRGVIRFISNSWVNEWSWLIGWPFTPQKTKTKQSYAEVGECCLSSLFWFQWRGISRWWNDEVSFTNIRETYNLYILASFFDLHHTLPFPF